MWTLCDESSFNQTLDWINSKNFNIENSSDDGSKRCFLEVDLDCPEELHDMHSDYPLASRSKKKDMVPTSITNHRRE